MFDIPRDDYITVGGLVFFARMLDKIRLHARGRLAPDYNLGFADPTSFDARFCRFWSVDYDQVTAWTLEGGTDEEIFDRCFAGRLPLNPEHILGWNNMLLKRGWRDDSAAELQEYRAKLGFGDRTDILTFVDLHDADEGRKPRYS